MGPLVGVRGGPSVAVDAMLFGMIFLFVVFFLFSLSILAEFFGVPFFSFFL